MLAPQDVHGHGVVVVDVGESALQHIRRRQIAAHRFQAFQAIRDRAPRLFFAAEILQDLGALRERLCLAVGLRALARGGERAVSCRSASSS